MRHVFFVLLILFPLRSVSQDLTNPLLLPSPNGVQLKFPAAMLTEIRRIDSDFKPFSESEYIKILPRWSPDKPNQALFAVIGDFNGDGTPDLVVDGHGADSTRRIALLSTNGGYQGIQLMAKAYVPPEAEQYDGEHGYWVCLNAVAPGRIESPCEETILDLATDAFEVGYYEKASVLYYWRNGRFHEYVTGD